MENISTLPSAMVVDDEQELSHLFMELLKGSGFNCVSFTDPLLAIEHISQNSQKYSLILTDLRMPGIGGIELARRIREYNSVAKIILITAFDIDEDLRDDLIEANISEVIQKPVKLKDLKARIANHFSSSNTTQRKELLPNEIDKIDVKILELLIQNRDNKQISSTVGIPLSTIQRRVKKLFEKGFIESKNQINFTKFGFKPGCIHIYLHDGNIDTILEKVAKLKGVTSLEVHIGNSDIICDVVYRDGRELLDIITNIKKMEGVEKTVWSERMYEYPLKKNNVSLLVSDPSLRQY